MASNKRERELARAKYERQSARRHAKASKQRRNQRIIAVVVVVALVLTSAAWAAWAFWGSDDEQVAVPPIATVSPSASMDASIGASPAPTDAASGEPTGEAAVIDCAAPGTNRANDMTFAEAPDPATATDGSLTLTTNCGDIVIALDATAAPATVASVDFLAQQGFYDSTSCHRLTTAGIYVLQCGDPLANGSGGPGYQLPDENLPADGDNNYPAGTVAMANAGAGTGGSQFFIVYQDTTLPGDYTIFGTVTSGLDIVQDVAAQGVADGSDDGAPTQPVFIEKATIQSQ